MNIKWLVKRLLPQKVRPRPPILDQLTLPPVSGAVADAARSIRGVSGRPVIFIQGVMPRCGSNYIAHLIGDHPDVHSLPNGLNEFPVLKHVDDLVRMQERFFTCYPHNRECMGEIDFLPLFGASIVSYLRGFGSKDETMLLKTPYVDNLNLFFTLFPHEQLVVVLRDGRDVVSSTMKTWPDKFQFDKVCKAWAANTERILAFDDYYRASGKPLILIKFEDAVSRPDQFVTEVCRRFGLDRDRYPFDKLDDTPVIGSSTLRVEGQMTWKEVPKPNGFNPVGRWKAWTQKEKATFVKHAGEILKKAGYCKDFKWSN